VPLRPQQPGSAGLVAAVERIFRPDGPLARALPGFEPRPGQLEMALAAARVMAGGGVLLAEAGTGTGKTLAYLVPAILSRQNVLVSTGTKNLQEQIYLKDLPVLRRALDVRFSATYMKGRANYLCIQRFESLRRDPAARMMHAEILAVLERWSGDTETGDRAEVAELPDDQPLWNEIAATSETCLGTKCPHHDECFITRMRQRAATSDLVIVNHHLLCADAAVRQSDFGAVVPDCRCAILDEAHQLEDVATQMAGLSVSTYRLDELARDGDRLLGGRQVDDPDGEWRRAINRVGTVRRPSSWH
jgi:ATP-dependent DNA helicase DinG